MPGILHNDGRLIYQQLMGGIPALDRGTNLQLCLFTACTDNPILVTTTAAAFTEPVGGGYSRINLPYTALSAAGVLLTTNTPQTFSATGIGYSGGAVLGWFILTTGVTPRVLASEIMAGGPYTMGVGATLNVTPQIYLNL